MRTTGLYEKFFVRRTDFKDMPGGPKQDAKYFVLDLVHDPHALPAIEAYVESLENSGEYEALAADLRERYLNG